MQFFIQLFGSGMNFFGGPGESHHKTFVKIPGQQTQRRVGEFAVQVADRVYEDLLYTTVQTFNEEESDIYESPCAQNNITGHDDEDADFDMSGEYSLCFNSEDDYSVRWLSKDQEKKSLQYKLNKDMIQVITHQFIGLDVGFPCTLKGNTTLTSHTSDGDCTFRAHPCFRGKPWHDWAYVSFIEQNKCGDDQENLYP